MNACFAQKGKIIVSKKKKLYQPCNDTSPRTPCCLWRVQEKNEKFISLMFFVSFQWPWHPRHYINSWNEAIYLMNMSVSDVYAPAPCELFARLTLERKWAPPLVVMSVKLNAWPGVSLSNFTHRGTKNGRNRQYIWKIFYLWNWILRQWGQPPVDGTGSLETKLAMLPQSPCAAEHTITHW